MKSLVDFIYEENVSVSDEIRNLTYSWIDYMYNEGVIDYDDRHLVDYKNGKRNPDFKDIIKGLLSEYNSDLSNTSQIVLKKYLKNGKPTNKESAVEKAILDAITKFTEDGNCENLI